MPATERIRRTTEEVRILRCRTHKIGGCVKRSSFMKSIETHNSIELPRYSDKYRPSASTQPTLKRKDLHQPFFPAEIFEDYFNPKRKKKGEKFSKIFPIWQLITLFREEIRWKESCTWWARRGRWSGILLTSHHGHPNSPCRRASQGRKVPTPVHKRWSQTMTKKTRMTTKTTTSTMAKRITWMIWEVA